MCNSCRGLVYILFVVFAMFFGYVCIMLVLFIIWWRIKFSLVNILLLNLYNLVPNEFRCKYLLANLKWRAVKHQKTFKELQQSIGYIILNFGVMDTVTILLPSLNTYIIGHYNSSVRIIDLVSHTTYVVCVNFIHNWRDLQFKVDFE